MINSVGPSLGPRASAALTRDLAGATVDCIALGRCQVKLGHVFEIRGATQLTVIVCNFNPKAEAIWARVFPT